jgi:hypothetical protein
MSKSPSTLLDTIRRQVDADQFRAMTDEKLRPPSVSWPNLENAALQEWKNAQINTTGPLRL